MFTTGSKAGIPAKHAKRLILQLQALHTAFSIEDTDIPGWNLHSLSGDKANNWAIVVNNNWRIVFAFENGDVYVVNYEDYH